MANNKQFERRSVEMQVAKGFGVWLFVKIEGKDGKVRNYVMKEVNEFWEGRQQEVGFGEVIEEEEVPS